MAARNRRYVTGWIKRGPTGIIGTNLICANQTVATVFEDLQGGNLEVDGKPGFDRVGSLLQERGVNVIDTQGWRRILEAELAKGSGLDKPREKMVRVEEMIAAATA